MQNTGAVIYTGITRSPMSKSHPNCMCEVIFRPMLSWVWNELDKAEISARAICAADGDEGIKEIVGETPIFSANEEKVHPAFAASQWLSQHKDYDVFVLCGESPFITAEALIGAYESHIKMKEVLTLLSSGDRNTLVREQNASAFIVKADFLLDFYNRAGEEKLLPDTLVNELSGYADFCHLSVGAYETRRREFNLRAENYLDLLRLNDIARARTLQALCANGVEVLSADGVVIAPGVKVGEGTKIYSGTMLLGDTVVGENCIIGPSTTIENCTVGNNSTINSSQLKDSRVGSNVKIGPFCQVRPGSDIGDGVKIGDFVEIKNSVVGARTSVAHLTYIGDSDVGEGVNFGCGCATVNYDGKDKFRTKIGDNAFIGCNTNLVAPVTVGSWAYTAAGTTVTEDVPDYALAIDRNPQCNKTEWVKKKDKLKKR